MDRIKCHSNELLRFHFISIAFFFFNEDDLTMTADGVDTYQTVKDAKRYK